MYSSERFLGLRKAHTEVRRRHRKQPHRLIRAAAHQLQRTGRRPPAQSSHRSAVSPTKHRKRQRHRTPIILEDSRMSVLLTAESHRGPFASVLRAPQRDLPTFQPHRQQMRRRTCPTTPHTDIRSKHICGHKASHRNRLRAGLSVVARGRDECTKRRR